jgi:hypothetical protein
MDELTRLFDRKNCEKKKLRYRTPNLPPVLPSVSSSMIGLVKLKGPSPTGLVRAAPINRVDAELRKIGVLLNISETIRVIALL